MSCDRICSSANTSEKQGSPRSESRYCLIKSKCSGLTTDILWRFGVEVCSKFVYYFKSTFANYVMSTIILLAVSFWSK